MLNKEVQDYANSIVKKYIKSNEPDFADRAVIMAILKAKFPDTQRATLVSAFGRAMRERRRNET